MVVIFKMSSEKLNFDHEPTTAPEIDDNLESAQTINSKDQLNQSTERSRNLEINRLTDLALEQPQQRLELPIDDSPNQSIEYTDKKAKKITLNNELKTIRHDLTTEQKMFSHLIHQPTIRKISSLSENTVARPSALLAGGLLAFIGSLTYLMLAKYIGVKYNYFIFIMLFLIGYLLSLIVAFLRKRISGFKS